MVIRERTRGVSHRVGLDIGSHSVRGVEVMEHGSELVIRSAGSAAISGLPSNQESPDDSSVVQAIGNLWASARFETNKVALALPSEAAHMKWLNLEPSDGEKLDAIARATAARGAPFPVDDAVLDYRVLSSGASGSRTVYSTMLVAVSSSALDHLLNLAERAGLETIGVDLGIPAALRSFEAQEETSDPLWGGQPRAHCVIGAKSTTIAIVRGNNLEFARTVPVGGNDFTQCVAESLGVDPTAAEKTKTHADARLTDDGMLITSHSETQGVVPCRNLMNRLARETTRSLRFFSSQFAEGSYLGMIGTVTLSGGGALLKGIDTCLRHYGIEVSGIINPFAGFAVDAEGSGIEQVGDRVAAFTTAVGLAAGDWRNRGATSEARAA